MPAADCARQGRLGAVLGGARQPTWCWRRRSFDLNVPWAVINSTKKGVGASPLPALKPGLESEDAAPMGFPARLLAIVSIGLLAIQGSQVKVAFRGFLLQVVGVHVCL